MATTIAGAEQSSEAAKEAPRQQSASRSDGGAAKDAERGDVPDGKANAGSTSPEVADGASALELLREARLKLDGYSTLKAKMVERISFGPRQFQAEGVYLQGSNNRLRLDLSVTLEKNTGRLLQICDGDILWTIYDVGDPPRVTRRDVTQILAAADKAGLAGQLARDLGQGGIPALLASIEQSMEFEPPMRADIEGHTFLVIQGTWSDAALKQLKKQAQSFPAPSETPRPLPAHVPDLVRLYLDAELKFPYRIRYLKQVDQPGADPEPILTLDFRDIVVNPPIDPAEFRYSAPDGANVVDLTNFYLRQLRGGQNPPAPLGAAPNIVPK